jgi:hypothetical protein
LEVGSRELLTPAGLKYDTSDLSLPSSYYYRCEPPVPSPFWSLPLYSWYVIVGYCVWFLVLPFNSFSVSISLQTLLIWSCLLYYVLTTSLYIKSQLFKMVCPIH